MVSNNSMLEGWIHDNKTLMQNWNTPLYENASAGGGSRRNPTKHPTVWTDTQQEILRPLLPTRKPIGPPPANLRQTLNASFYLPRTGCQ
jgi:hypothetical protein